MVFKLVFSFAAILVIKLTVAAIPTQDTNKCPSDSCGSHGVPGVPGIPGSPGKDGPHGAKGDLGHVGSVGRKGDPGVPGNPGKDGTPCPKGGIGSAGAVGPGGKRLDGLGLIATSNWKQCAWKNDDDKDNGLIKNCVFNKKHDNTSLRVFYGGNLRIYNCDNCCKRWYFTFDGAECKNPMTIDGVFYMRKGAGTQDLHRHRNIEGYCNQVPKGHVRVGFWVGNCVGFGNADAYSGWNSVSRIVIQEVPPPQA